MKAYHQLIMPHNTDFGRARMWEELGHFYGFEVRVYAQHLIDSRDPRSLQDCTPAVCYLPDWLIDVARQADPDYLRPLFETMGLDGIEAIWRMTGAEGVVSMATKAMNEGRRLARR